MCDRTEAWVVEVSGRQWVAERVTSMKWLDLSVVRRRDFAVISPASFLFLVSFEFIFAVILHFCVPCISRCFPFLLLASTGG